MNQHRTWRRTILLAGLLLVGLAPAQNQISMYGGMFRTGQAVEVEVSAPLGSVFTVARILDPAGMFEATKDPHSPQIPGAAGTRTVQTVRLTRSMGQRLRLGTLPSGVYVIRSGGVGTVLLVTRLGMVIKRDQQQALTYTADQNSGQARAARVWALGGSSNVLSNADGLTTFEGEAGSGEVYLARYGNDWAISGANWNSYAAPLVRGYVYTDRPVYRPGQHVEFKAVLRKAGTLAPLAGRSVRVTVSSPFDDEVFRRTLTTNSFGSLSAGLDLPQGAKLGEYHFTVSPAGADGDGQADIGGSFQVEAYQKPEYAVTLVPSKTQAVQGEKVNVHISARYLFGGNVSGALVNYNVTRAPYYPPGFDTDSLPPDQQDDGQDYGSDLVIQDETRLNANGDLDLTLPLERDADGKPISYRIEAEVEDESRRTVSAQTRVIAFPAALNVEASTDNYIYNVGAPIRVALDTRDLNQKGRAAPVTLDLIRQNWDNSGNDWKLTETRLSRTQVRTDASGTLNATLHAPRGGGYLVRATVKDAQGRSSTNENFVWVLKPGEDWGWNYNDLTVQLDKKKYAPGDTATALIGNPKPGAAVLVTLEGDKLRKSVVLRGKGAVLTYKFPVSADMTPNIYVSAASLSDGKFYSHETRVKVPRIGAELSVTVKAKKPRYAPGETGTFSVDVKNAAGQGVPAEVAVGVVDQAIYLVQRDDAQPMLQVFDALRDNAVGTDSSLSFYFEQGRVAQGAPKPAAPMTEAAFAQSKDARDSAAPSNQEPVTPRQDFKDTILWIPKLLTDAKGHADVTVRFPDNLTTWVATARAQTQSARFGQTTASTLTTKDVIARLSLPPFLVRGDTVTLSGIVNNTLNTAVTGRAQMTLSGLSALSGAALTPAGAPLKLSANGRARTDVQVKAETVGNAGVTFTARTASGQTIHNDALKLPLPVKARGYDVTQTAVGSGTTPLKFTVAADANPQTTTLNLSLTPSLLSAVGGALNYLVGYPYGCTEQTMSRFLPALLARQTLGAAQLPASVVKDLPAITEAGLARLALFQHEDGGWNFWQWDDSTLEMTAYVTQGLLRAKALGAKVENSMLDRALQYLATHAADPKERQADRASAYRALAQAGRVKAGQLATFAKRRDLEPYALAQTALALHASGQTQAARDLLDRLKARRSASQNGALVHWETPKTGDSYGWWYDFWDDNSIQVTAAALEAIATLDPSSPLIPSVSQWLLSNRRGPQWLSTQDTTSVIIAALALKPAPLPAPSTVTVALDGKQVGSVKVSSSAAGLTIGAGKLSAGSHTLTLQGAPAALFSAAQLSYAREPAALNADAAHGFRLSRRYERLDPVWDAANKRYTYRRTPLLKAGQMMGVTTGDLVLVTLTVQPMNHSARYLLVSDPVPAGMKALDERSLAIAGLPDPDENDWEGWNYWYAGRDLLDDRVDLYADYLEGQQTMTYLLRAQTPGTFTALPTHAFLMYDPEVQGYSAAATLTVRDRGQ
ncbi:MG2 domain-containing protein (plasmid) [Deinococcus sp. KNUC1210]|uniref:alpha-2-macroglobulin family protein n=1 Tax=Deinococcus sp. KNUC1210 TaxID=2917691 RepID=UPI001EF08036|nr:MG2 domain-containing protein [Deinococcus sp. KNUC1210]ULH17201.1 MG2 domain-containing protein [Deinococcus sp. KNUC1210]